LLAYFDNLARSIRNRFIIRLNIAFCYFLQLCELVLSQLQRVGAKGQCPVQTFKQVLGDVLLLEFEGGQDELLHLLLLQEQLTVVLLNALQHAEVDERQHVK